MLYIYQGVCKVYTHATQVEHVYFDRYTWSNVQMTMFVEPQTPPGNSPIRPRSAARTLTGGCGRHPVRMFPLIPHVSDRCRAVYTSPTRPGRVFSNLLQLRVVWYTKYRFWRCRRSGMTAVGRPWGGVAAVCPCVSLRIFWTISHGLRQFISFHRCKLRLDRQT